MTKKTDNKEPDRWYLGEGISRIIDGDISYLVVKVAEFPESQWAEWDKDCKLNFSNCRWAKMMDNHNKAKMFDLMVANKFSMAEQKQEEKIEVTMSGEKIE